MEKRVSSSSVRRYSPRTRVVERRIVEGSLSARSLSIDKLPLISDFVAGDEYRFSAFMKYLMENHRDLFDKCEDSLKKVKVFFLGTDEFGFSDLITGLKNILTTCSMDEITVIAAVLKYARMKREEPDISGLKGRTSSSIGFMTTTEKGRQALMSHIEPGFLEPISADQANKLWPKEIWDKHVNEGNSPEEAFKEMLKEVSFDGTQFAYQFTGSKQSVCGRDVFPDVVLKLNIPEASLIPSITGALLELHSKGKRARYDTPSAIGELSKYGEAFLNEVEYNRTWILVGTTDLVSIRWFKVFRGGTMKRLAVDPVVRQCLCTLLNANPSSLGIRGSGVSVKLPDGFELKEHLGEGRTAMVYKVKASNGLDCAVKISKKQEINLHRDIFFLDKLKSIGGVPQIIHPSSPSYYIMHPVGEMVSLNLLAKYCMQKSLCELVEILQSAHAVGVVNRDIRIENILIAQAAKTQAAKMNRRLYIVDWGFASDNIGAEVIFSGNIHSASNRVLMQLHTKCNVVAYYPADDLVSLVRCIFLLFHNHFREQLFQIEEYSYIELCSFWDMVMEQYPLWKKAEAGAEQLDYNSVWDLFEVSSSFF